MIFSPSLEQKEGFAMGTPACGAAEIPRSGRAVDSFSTNEETIDKVAAVAVTKSASRPVRKVSDDEVLQRRVSPRLVGARKPVYFSPTFQKREVQKRKKKVIVEQKDESQTSRLKTSSKDDAVERKQKAEDGVKHSSSDRVHADAHEGDRQMESNALVVAIMSDAARVKDTLRIFNAHFLHFVQEEEKRCKKKDDDIDAKKAASLQSKEKSCKVDMMVNGKKSSMKSTKLRKGGGSKLEETKRSSKRPDLKAITKMLETGAVLYPDKKFGNIPGIEVGHQFFSRAEMVVLGFHGHWLNGIDFMGRSYSKLAQYKDLKFPVAVSAVLSGMYEDDVDNSEDIVYTGQGGHDLLGNKRQIGDQIMQRGNLALKHNMEQNIPVRVTRGHESANSYCGKVYTYDGLYKVVEYWAEKGVSGFTVYKYRLRRLDGQPPLTTGQVHFSRAQPPKCLSDLRGLVSKDISGGQEKIPIPATNVVDDPPFPPSGFIYSKQGKVASNIEVPPDAKGCSCVGVCIDSRSCACAKLNGGDFPYVRRDGGRLVVAKDVVYECGPNCGCGPDCINRISQQDIRYRLEVFRTPSKGWGVRSWDSIPSGAPVCEYIGILMRTDDIDDSSENNFIFEIDCLQTMKEIDGRQRRFGDVSKHIAVPPDVAEEKKAESLPEYCLDAVSIGNVTRFINHSCEPNLFVQCVLSSHHDMKLARVVLFAADNIPPLQELSYDYNYLLDSVVGPDGKVKELLCYCGTADCRKRLY
ncbi:Histone-lysine N-methyltransferase H3 lysine-9 specific [Nymphaea thermarum]|nr:Histone-lysine N-methyltransferase H3 lysine-9 specific [Nymphaea thermarum]